MSTEAIKEDLDPNSEQKAATIHVSFKTNSDQIKIINKATNEKSAVVAANKKIRLINGRLYFIPIDHDMNSDEYGNMKQYSETSDKFIVRYIKEGTACIDPIQHNALVENGQTLCVIW
jgi:hypothetical protein